MRSQCGDEILSLFFDHMSHVTWNVNGEQGTWEQIESVDEGVACLHTAIQRLIAEGRQKPIIIDIIGWPNSGKTYFIRKFLESYQVMRENNDYAFRVVNGVNDKESDGEIWAHAATADGVLVHDATGGLNLPLLPRIHGREFDIGIIIYNPLLQEDAHSSISFNGLRAEYLNIIKYVVVNRESVRKNLN